MSLGKLSVTTAAVAAALALSACGGGGGGSDSNPAPQTKTISGTAMKGTLQGAKVYAYAVGSDGKISATALNADKPAITNADGTYTLDIGNYSGPLLVKVVADTGTKMEDELTGTVTIDAGKAFELRALLQDVQAGSTANVTPLSEIALTQLSPDGKALRDNNGDGKVDSADIKNIGTMTNAVALQLTGKAIDPLSYQFNPKDTTDQTSSVLQQASLLFNKPETMPGCEGKALNCALGKQSAALGTISVKADKFEVSSPTPEVLVALATSTSKAFEDAGKVAAPSSPNLDKPLDEVIGKPSDLENLIGEAKQIAAAKELINSTRATLAGTQSELQVRLKQVSAESASVMASYDAMWAMNDSAQGVFDAEIGVANGDIPEYQAPYPYGVTRWGDNYHCERVEKQTYDCTLFLNDGVAQYTMTVKKPVLSSPKEWKVDWKFANGLEGSAIQIGDEEYLKVDGQAPFNNNNGVSTIALNWDERTEGAFTGYATGSNSDGSHVKLTEGKASWVSDATGTKLYSSASFKLDADTANGLKLLGDIASGDPVSVTGKPTAHSSLTLNAKLSKGGVSWFEGKIAAKLDKPHEYETSAGTLSINGAVPFADRTVKVDSTVTRNADQSGSATLTYSDKGVLATATGKAGTDGKPTELTITSRNLVIKVTDHQNNGDILADGKLIGKIVGGKKAEFKDGSSVSLI